MASTKKKSAAGGLSGWRLKKAQRKAQKEAETQGIPYKKYVADNYPELAESGDEETVDNVADEKAEKTEAKKAKSKSKKASSSDTPSNKEVQDGGNSATAETTAKKNPKPSSSKGDKQKEKKAEGKEVKDTKDAKKEETKKDVSKATNKESKDAAKKKDASTSETTSGSKKKYSWQTGNNKADKMEKRRAELLVRRLINGLLGLCELVLLAELVSFGSVWKECCQYYPCASPYLSATACASLYLSATACAILPTLEFHVFNSSALTRACAGSDNVRQYRRLKAISLRCLFNDLCCASILPACCLVNYRNGFTLLGVGRRRGN